MHGVAFVNGAVHDTYRGVTLAGKRTRDEFDGFGVDDGATGDDHVEEDYALPSEEDTPAPAAAPPPPPSTARPPPTVPVATTEELPPEDLVRAFPVHVPCACSLRCDLMDVRHPHVAWLVACAQPRGVPRSSFCALVSTVVQTW